MNNVVFLVLHSYESTHGEDLVKTIGIYSSQAAAEEAVGRLINLPGFSDYPEGFSIDSYFVDEDHWTSGFGGAEVDWPMEEGQ